jgi:hypothetical protein
MASPFAVLFQKRIDKLYRRELQQVGHFFADADEADWER